MKGVSKPFELLQKVYQLKRDKYYDWSIVEHKQKRSLDANAYYWELVNRIANKVRLSKEEVHFDLLKEYGQSIIVKVIKEVDPRKYFRYYEEDYTDKEFAFYKVYQGSSSYDTEQMSILIDGALQECANLGIEEDVNVKINHK